MGSRTWSKWLRRVSVVGRNRRGMRSSIWRRNASGASSLDFRRFRLFSGCRGEIQPAAVEVDRIDEVLLVTEAAGCVLHPLDLGVDGLAGRVGDAVLEVGDDVGEAAFECAGYFFHRSQTAAHRPSRSEEH